MATTSKTMSSRLMNMKFMQRANTKGTEAAATPQKDSSARPVKRRKTQDSISGVDSDSPFAPTPTAVDAARDELLARQAEEAGDTKWSLENGTFKVPAKPARGLQVSFAGYGEIDNGAQVGSDSDEAEEVQADTSNSGRRSFGPAKKHPEQKQNMETGSSTMDTSSSDLSDSDESDAHLQSDHARQKSSNMQQDVQTPQRGKGGFAKSNAKTSYGKGYTKSRKDAKPHGDEIDLDRLTSISGGSGGTKRKSLPPANGGYGRHSRNAFKSSKRGH